MFGVKSRLAVKGLTVIVTATSLDNPSTTQSHLTDMDAILGTWVAYPKDFDNLPGYLQALGRAHMNKSFEQGLEMTIVKEGGDYIISRTVGGMSLFKEALRAGGKVELVGSEIPDGVIELTHKWEGGRLVMDGAIKGKQTHTDLKVDGNTMTAEITINGFTVTIRYTKKA